MWNISTDLASKIEENVKSDDTRKVLLQSDPTYNDLHSKRIKEEFFLPDLNTNAKQEIPFLEGDISNDNEVSMKVELSHEEVNLKTEILNNHEEQIIIQPTEDKSLDYVLMNPINDIVCNLLETPFNRWCDDDKRDVFVHQGRPTPVLKISVRKEVKKSGRSYNVNFKTSWFSEHKWLCSSSILQKLFCWPCLLFSHKHSVWNRDGFADFINITRSMHKHGDCGEHLKCMVLFRNFEKNQNTIADALKENARLYKLQFNENVRLNRLCLQKVIKAVLYLGKQELPFRGHNENSDSVNCGNFKELLSVFLEDSSLEIKNHFEKNKNNFSEDSKTLQNEVIECVSSYINDHVINEISESDFFSIQIDDTTDITQTSQCSASVTIRFVESQGILVERFLGFHDVSAGATVDNLFAMLNNILERLDYQNKAVGQWYDGASVMSGHLNGLQKKIKEKAPQAVFVHSLGHRLNHVLQQSFKKISKCRIFFKILNGIPPFFHNSPKRSHALASASARRIPTTTETRWSSNSKLLCVIVQDWGKLKEVFENIAEESDTISMQLAKGYLKDMNDFEFTFLAVVFHDIFGVTDILYDILQKNSLDINFCITHIKRTRELLSNKRNEDFFTTIFNNTNKMTEMHFISKRQDTGLTQDLIITKYRTLFYEILDHILMEMDVRFQDCDKLQFLCLADTTKFEQNKLSFPADAFENVLQSYGKIFTKTQRLKNELVLLYADEDYRDISLQELLKKLQGHKDVFTEAYKLFCLIITIPSTSMSVESSFSYLKCLKTFTRNTISQERLSNLATISLHQELLLNLMRLQPFYDGIIDKFASLKDRKINLVYKN